MSNIELKSLQTLPDILVIHITIIHIKAELGKKYSNTSNLTPKPGFLNVKSYCIPSESK